MLTYTPNKTKGRVMLPIFMEKSVTENSLAVPYCNTYYIPIETSAHHIDYDAGA